MEEEESFSYRESVKRSRTRASLPDRCQPEKEGVRASATMKLLQEAEEATNNKKVKKEKNNFDFFLFTWANAATLTKILMRI